MESQNRNSNLLWSVEKRRSRAEAGRDLEKWPSPEQISPTESRLSWSPRCLLMPQDELPTSQAGSCPQMTLPWLLPLCPCCPTLLCHSDNSVCSIVSFDSVSFVQNVISVLIQEFKFSSNSLLCVALQFTYSCHLLALSILSPPLWWPGKGFTHCRNYVLCLPCNLQLTQVLVR